MLVLFPRTLTCYKQGQTKWCALHEGVPLRSPEPTQDPCMSLPLSLQEMNLSCHKIKYRSTWPNNLLRVYQLHSWSTESFQGYWLLYQPLPLPFFVWFHGSVVSCSVSHTIWKVKKITTLYYLNGLIWKDPWTSSRASQRILLWIKRINQYQVMWVWSLKRKRVKTKLWDIPHR